ncbi:MAG: hypothetical protein KDD56_07330, partial [Bdellovibrionales bacterium]|nr:hypothetical protein [Bdellovibrionales bacterium]
MWFVPSTRKKRSLVVMKGNFTKNLFSLQLQLKTLLEDAGGEEAIELLDTLCKLNKSEQGILLKVINRLLSKVLNNGPRFETDGDLALKKFEDDLYQDLVSALTQGTASEKPKRFEVLNGGKNSTEPNKPQLIELNKFRTSRSKQ